MTVNVLRRIVSATVLVGYSLGATGCHSWSTQSGSAESVLAAQPRERVRITTRADSQMTEVQGPRVVNDTLFGVIAGSQDTTAFALDQVTAVQVQKGSPGKTVGLVAGVTLGALVVTGLVAAATCEPSFGSIC